MSTYNDIIINQINGYLQLVLSRASARDQMGRLLRIDSVKNYETEEDNIPDLIRMGESSMFNLTVTIGCFLNNQRTKTYECNLEIPKMINGLFIIDGRYRVPTSTLSMDYSCRIYDKNIQFDPRRNVVWSFPKGEPHEWNPIRFKLLLRDDDNNEISLDCTQEIFDEYKDLLKLDERQIDKLQVKLDTDDIPEYITVDLIRQMFEYGPDKKKDHIVDKTIANVETDLIHHLRLWDNMKDVIGDICFQWWNNDEIYLSSVQNVIKKYFKMAKSKYIEIPSNVNPLVYDTLKNKVRFPHFTSFNQTFADIIDPFNTPENGNVNILNELNVCVSIENGEMMYTCYDFKTKSKIKIPYVKYLTKKVLKNDYFDYDKLAVKPATSYKYTLRCKTYETTNPEDCDLIEPAPDDKLSLTTRRIPLVNMSDSVRVSMGCTMAKQAIQTEGNEPRLVDSGNDDTDAALSINLICYEGKNPGVVKEIKDGQIFIEDSTGLLVMTAIPDATVGASSSMMTNDPIVRVGDQILPGQVLATPTIMKRGFYELGTNANAVYMNYLGYTYEDGVVISQSYADKMTHYSLISITKTIKRGDTLRGIASIGKKVTSKELIVSNDSNLKVSDSISDGIAARKTITTILNPRTNQSNLVVPNNIEEGYIVDVRITSNPRPAEKNGISRKIYLSKVTEETLDKFTKQKPVDDYLVLPEKYRQLHCSEYSDFKNNDDLAISFLIVSKNPMCIGDKSTNSYGSKGIISLILPDELMPRKDEDGHGNGKPYDIIMNPAAVVSRKNPSQLYECLLTKIIEEIYETNLYVVNKESDVVIQKQKDGLSEYYGDRFEKMTLEEFKEASKDIFNFKMKVGSFAKVSYDQVMKWASELGVAETDQVYCPDVFIYQDTSGTKVVSPEEAEKKGLNGKLYELGFMEAPVVTGKSYMYKLHKNAKAEGKVTSSDMSSEAPLLGKGHYRAQGQKIGEMELWNLLENGATSILTEDNPDIERGENLLINQLLLAGFALSGRQGLPFNTEYEYKINQLRKQNK